MHTKYFMVYYNLMNFWHQINPGFQVIKLLPCSTQLSKKFQLLIKTNMLKNKDYLAFKLSNVVFIMLINVTMPTIVGIITFISMINFMLLNSAWIKFYNLGSSSAISLVKWMYLVDEIRSGSATSFHQKPADLDLHCFQKGYRLFQKLSTQCTY